VLAVHIFRFGYEMYMLSQVFGEEIS
jgi:hypothetical protein